MRISYPCYLWLFFVHLCNLVAHVKLKRFLSLAVAAFSEFTAVEEDHFSKWR